MAQFIMARHNGAGDLNTTYLLHILHHRGNCISLYYIKLQKNKKKIKKSFLYIYVGKKINEISSNCGDSILLNPIF